MTEDKKIKGLDQDPAPATDEEIKEREKVMSFLHEERPKHESIGCGFHGGVFYFGTRVWRDGKAYTAIVTSDKNFYVNKRVRIGRALEGENEIKTNFGLNYKNDFFDEGVDNIFSNKAIDAFLQGDISHITLEGILEDIVKILKQYMYFDVETKYKVVALYRMAGFFMHTWSVRARLFIHAEMGSAKSRLTDILHNTGFNSVNLGDWTLPFIQRMIESVRGEAHIDDFETLDDEKKKATTRLIRTGYMKGKKAGKVSDNGRRPEVYDLFNTVTVNNTEGLDFISNDRCITIRIPKIAMAKYDQEPDFKEEFWGELRDKLYIMGLKYAFDIVETYPTIKSEKVRGRLLSIIKPELTIARLISNDLFNEIEKWWEQEIDQRDPKELKEDWEFRAYEKIYCILNKKKKKDDDYFGLSDDVVQPLLDDLYPIEERKSFKRKMATVIGRCLSRDPRFKNRTVNGRTQYKVKKQEFIDLMKAKRLFKHIQTYSSTSSPSSTSSTTSPGSTKKVEPVEQVEVVGGVELVEQVGGKPHAQTSVIIKILQDNDKGEGVSFDTLRDLTNIDEAPLMAELKRLCIKGVVCEPRRDYWRLV